MELRSFLETLSENNELTAFRDPISCAEIPARLWQGAQERTKTHRKEKDEQMTTSKMYTWRFHEFGHIKNLQMEQVEIPTPVRDEVLVKIDYAGLNPADAFLVMGRYPGAGEPPFSVGRDGCGRIVDANSIPLPGVLQCSIRSGE